MRAHRAHRFVFFAPTAARPPRGRPLDFPRASAASPPVCSQSVGPGWGRDETTTLPRALPPSARESRPRSFSPHLHPCLHPSSCPAGTGGRTHPAPSRPWWRGGTGVRGLFCRGSPPGQSRKLESGEEREERTQLGLLFGARRRTLPPRSAACCVCAVNTHEHLCLDTAAARHTQRRCRPIQQTGSRRAHSLPFSARGLCLPTLSRHGGHSAVSVCVWLCV